jgi:hypothetical protein
LLEGSSKPLNKLTFNYDIVGAVSFCKLLLIYEKFERFFLIYIIANVLISIELLGINSAHNELKSPLGSDYNKELS